MLVAGLRSHDLREVAGQVPRMVASVLFSRLWVPRGNSGRSRVSAFAPMSVPEACATSPPGEDPAAGGRRRWRRVPGPRSWPHADVPSCFSQAAGCTERVKLLGR